MSKYSLILVKGINNNKKTIVDQTNPLLERAKCKLAADILVYAEDFYNEFNYWNAASNRKKHAPYVLKALILQDITRIEELIQC